MNYIALTTRSVPLSIDEISLIIRAIQSKVWAGTDIAVVVSLTKKLQEENRP